MSDEIVSGEKITALERRPLGSPWNSSSDIDMSSDLDITGSKGAGIHIHPRPARRGARRDSNPRPQPVTKGDAPAMNSPESRDAVRRHWDAARRYSSQMIVAADCGDPISLSNAASDLVFALDDLWKLRGVRESDWGGVLNFLQGVMKSIDHAKGYESLTSENCRAIESVVNHHLGTWTIDKENVREALHRLRSAGLDPWAPISEEQED